MEFLLQNKIWIAEFLFLIAFLATLNGLLKRAITRSRKQALRTGNAWLAHMEEALSTPLTLLLWILLLTFSLDLLGRYFELKGTFLHLTAIRNGGVVICFTWFLFRWKTRVYREMKNQKGPLSMDLTSLEIFDKIFTVIALFVSLLIILSLFHIDIVPLVTFGGIGAAALGFASKDVIANFFGGLMLYATRPFNVNDLVELPQKELKGHIENIGWYFTSIRDLNKTLIYVPNYMFPTELVVNLSRMTHRYFHEYITLRLTDSNQLSSFIEKIQQVLKTSPHIDQHLKPLVHLSNVYSHALEIEVRAYLIPTRYEEYMQAKQSLLIEINQIMDELKIQSPISLELLGKALSGNS